MSVAYPIGRNAIANTVLQRVAGGVGNVQELAVQSAAAAFARGGRFFLSGGNAVLENDSAAAGLGTVIRSTAGSIVVEATTTAQVQSSGGGGSILVWGATNTFDWYGSGVRALTKTLAATGNCTYVWTAKVDRVEESFDRRDEDTAIAFWSRLGQQPSASATGTNRDSGGERLTIYDPTDEAGGGRWGTRVVYYGTDAKVQDIEHHGEVSTTDATATPITGAQSDALPQDSVVFVVCRWKIRDTTGGAVRAVVKAFLFSRVGAAAPSQDGATSTWFDDGDAFGGAVTTNVVATGNAIRPTFTGLAGSNFKVTADMVVSFESA